jgi:hypothetical protein
MRSIAFSVQKQFYMMHDSVARAVLFAWPVARFE